MEPDQAIVKPSEPGPIEAGRGGPALWLRWRAMAGPKHHRAPHDPFDAEPPRPLPPSLSGSIAGSSMTFWPVAENVPDHVVLELAEITAPRHGELKRNPNGTLTYIPDPAFTGIDRFGYTLTDGEGNLYPASVTVAVEHDDTPPESEPPAAAEKRAPGMTGFSQGEHGTVALDDEGALVYTPKAGFAGLDSFTYTVVDEAGAESTAHVTVEIEPSGAYRVIRQGSDGAS